MMHTKICRSNRIIKAIQVYKTKNYKIINVSSSEHILYVDARRKIYKINWINSWLNN